jgi:hypothetical protein
MKAVGNSIMILGLNAMIIAGMWALDDEQMTPQRLAWFGAGWIVLGAVVHVGGVIAESARGAK